MAKAVKKNPDRVRVRHSKEFKLEAVRLLKLGQKQGTELALELSLRRDQLYKWRSNSKAREAIRRSPSTAPGAYPTTSLYGLSGVNGFSLEQ